MASAAGLRNKAFFIDTIVGRTKSEKEIDTIDERSEKENDFDRSSTVSSTIVSREKSRFSTILLLQYLSTRITVFSKTTYFSLKDNVGIVW